MIEVDLIQMDDYSADSCAIIPSSLLRYVHRYVITGGLWSKYDVHGHCFRFVAQILANP